MCGSVMMDKRTRYRKPIQQSIDDRDATQLHVFQTERDTWETWQAAEYQDIGHFDSLHSEDKRKVNNAIRRTYDDIETVSESLDDEAIATLKEWLEKHGK